MKSRLVASLALGAIGAVGLTGCAFISPQATTIQYSPSDGVSVSNSGPIEVRNAFVVVDADGKDGNLVAGLVNADAKAQTLHIEVDGSDQQLVLVDGDGMVSLGGADQPLRLNNIDAAPGSTIKIYFQSGDVEGADAQIPVLDGTLPYYADLVPSPEPTMTPMPSPVFTAQATEPPAGG